jgi:hypothetical protein
MKAAIMILALVASLCAGCSTVPWGSTADATDTLYLLKNISPVNQQFMNGINSIYK